MLWPVTKATARLSTLVESSGQGPTKLAVLLTTGACNPPHVGHVALLQKARECIEKQGFTVLTAFLSPSHDAYVQPKARNLGTLGFSSAFRIEVASRTAAADEIVEIGEWEAKQRGFVDFPGVCLNLKDTMKKWLSKSLPAEAPAKQQLIDGMTLFYCCGSDHAIKCRLYRGMHGFGVIVVPRTGEAGGNKAARLEDLPSQNVYIADPAEGEVSSISSTLVRQAMLDGNSDYLAAALSKEGAQLLCNPSKEEQDVFRNDFAMLKKFGSRA